MTKFGKELRKLRLDLGITLFEMAAAIGISPSLLSSVETGKRSVTPSLLDKLATAYDEIASNRAEYERLADETKHEVRIRLDAENTKANGVALAFARNFDSLTGQQLEELMAVFNNKKSEGG